MATETAFTLWLTGLSGSGKTTLAHFMKAKLSQSCACMVLDGDELRAVLNQDLGFTTSDRNENIRRAAAICRLLNDQNISVLAAFISPFAAQRESAREIIGPNRFFEVFLSAPLKVCEARDVKGFYRRARLGQMPNFTGIGARYEVPAAPWMTCDTSNLSAEECRDTILAALKRSR